MVRLFGGLLVAHTTESGDRREAHDKRRRVQTDNGLAVAGWASQNGNATMRVVSGTVNCLDAQCNARHGSSFHCGSQGRSYGCSVGFISSRSEPRWAAAWDKRRVALLIWRTPGNMWIMEPLVRWARNESLCYVGAGGGGLCGSDSGVVSGVLSLLLLVRSSWIFGQNGMVKTKKVPV